MKIEEIATLEKVVLIPIDKMDANPWNCNTMSQSQMSSLQASLAKNGKEGMQPLIARSLENGRFQIIDGEHRYLAAKNLNWTDVPVIVSNVNEEKGRVLCLSLNYIRGRIDPTKLFEILYKDWEGGEGSLTTRDLEKLYGQLFDQSWISRILQLRNLSVEVRAHAHSILSRDPDTNISIKHLFVLSQLKEKEDQMKFLDALVATSVSVSTFERMVDEYRARQERSQIVADENAEKAEKTEIVTLGTEKRRLKPASDSVFKCTCSSEYVVNWRRKTVLRIEEESHNMRATHVELIASER